MVARNDITGDLIKTKATMGSEFEENFKRIFGERKKEKYIPPPLPSSDYPDNGPISEEPAGLDW